MSIQKDLTVVITNDSEGLNLTLKSVSSLGPNVVFIQGDSGVHTIEEIEKALKEIKEFNRSKQEEQISSIHVP